MNVLCFFSKCFSWGSACTFDREYLPSEIPKSKGLIVVIGELTWCNFLKLLDLGDFDGQITSWVDHDVGHSIGDRLA